MSIVTVDHVKYYPKNDYYLVGNNETTIADGINDTSFSGEITIQAKIKGKEVKEISQYAFSKCINLKKVIIHAKLICINQHAFYGCNYLEYINIPETVTFMGWGALCLCNPVSPWDVDKHALIEFNEGRKQKVYIDGFAISRRTTFNIIYPSDLEPLYYSSSQFVGTKSAIICAKNEFSFCGKFYTKTDFKQCSASQYKPPVNYFISIAKNISLKSQIIIHIFIVVLTQPKRTDKSKSKMPGFFSRIIRKLTRKN